MTILEVPYGFVARLFLGEEVHTVLGAFAKQRGITAAWVQGIGALRSAEIGYFDLETRTYDRETFDQDLEVAPLVGNIGIKDGEPFAHLHVTLGARDFSARVGHLFRGEAGATLELRIEVFPGATLLRLPDETVGLGLLALPERFEVPDR
jgi:hypothetical protein